MKAAAPRRRHPERPLGEASIWIAATLPGGERTIKKWARVEVDLPEKPPHAQRRERIVLLLGWHLRSDRGPLLPRRRHRPDQARGASAARRPLVRRLAGQG